MNKKHEDEDLEMSKMGLVDGEIHQDKDKVTGDPPKPQTTASRIIDMACILLNIASTVTLVFLNKWIFRDPQLKNMQISFAMWHFTCTTIVLDRQSITVQFIRARTAAVHADDPALQFLCRLLDFGKLVFGI